MRVSDAFKTLAAIGVAEAVLIAPKRALTPAFVADLPARGSLGDRLFADEAAPGIKARMATGVQNALWGFSTGSLSFIRQRGLRQ